MSDIPSATSPGLTPDEVRASLLVALQTLVDNRDHLNVLDQGLGDGDHGTTIARGCEAAIAALKNGTFATANAVFEAVGSAMMTSMGGASGILFGVWFRAAKNCPAADTLSTGTLITFFQRARQELLRKSAAQVGDKTMMDALIPAIEALEANAGAPLGEALRTAADAAQKGAESTVGLLPKFGRATTLGERVRQAKDPGATSIALFLDTLAKEHKTTS
jgi:dihydroxyacetone kinase-like protein